MKSILKQFHESDNTQMYQPAPMSAILRACVCSFLNTSGQVNRAAGGVR